MATQVLMFYSDSNIPEDYKNALILLKDKSPKYNFKEYFLDSQPEIFEKYSVKSCPCSIVLSDNNAESGRVFGYDIPALYSCMLKAKKNSSEYLDEKIESILNSHSLVIFIKGTPQAPRCGFTKQLMELFKVHNINDFEYFDILTDESIRQSNDTILCLGLKEYSNWPTYPQIYKNGELVGGLDIVKELLASGEKL